MSSIPNGGSGITISPGQTRGFTDTWNNSGWQGITIFQPQPTWPPGVTLSYTEGSVNFNEGNETYGFNVSVTNNTKDVVTFNAQISSI
jgi:hypothetical protein